MDKTPNNPFEDSGSNLRNSSNKAPENPDESDIKRRFQKIGDDVSKIIGNGTIFDLRGDNLVKVTYTITDIEKSINTILDITGINKETRDKLSEVKIQNLISSVQSHIKGILNIQETV